MAQQLVQSRIILSAASQQQHKATVDAKEALSKFFVNDRGYFFNEATHTFENRFTKTRWGGALKRLKSAFYPRYTAPERRRGESSSRTLGQLIHRHIEHYVNCLGGKLPDPSVKKKRGAPKPVCKCTKKTPSGRLNKYALAIVKKLQEEEGVELVRAES